MVDWVVAKRIYTATTTSARRGWLLVSLITNLGIPGYFKYGEFLLENWIGLAAMACVEWQAPAWDFELPECPIFARTRRIGSRVPSSSICATRSTPEEGHAQNCST